MKRRIKDLAIFSHKPLFKTIVSTSNLRQPDPKKFFSYIKKSFEAKQLTNNGPIVQELEKKLAEIHQVKFCITTCSGFWAIAMCMKHLVKKDKNQVIMPSLTYRRMADIAAWNDLVPNFCDVDPQTLAMRPDLIEQRINQKTALIMGVHPIINLCDIEGLTQVAKKHNIPLLFDSVEAAFSSYKGKIIGSFGEAECFSAHASKFLNGFEGGYITTNNPDLAQKISTMRAFGFTKKDNVQYYGINAKLNEIHAAMMLSSIDEHQEQISQNYSLYKFYEKGLEEIEGLELVKYNEKEKRTYKNIIVKINKNWPLSRENTIEIMHKENMLVRPYYYPALHQKEKPYKAIHDNLKLTESLAQEYLLLPCGSFLKEEDVEKILSILHFMQKNGKEINKLILH